MDEGRAMQKRMGGGGGGGEGEERGGGGGNFHFRLPLISSSII